MHYNKRCPYTPNDSLDVEWIHWMGPSGEAVNSLA
jgi:hypothetical protein